MTFDKAFYEARVGECERAAAETTLDNVRDRNLRAAAAWQLMADQLADRESAAKASQEKRDAEIALAS